MVNQLPLPSRMQVKVDFVNSTTARSASGFALSG